MSSSEKQERYCFPYSFTVKIKHGHGGKVLSALPGPD